MYYRLLSVFFLLACFSIIMVGCAILAAQEWSENYALLEGTRATSPEMIDGNLNTIGQTNVSAETMKQLVRGRSEVVVTLPEKKMIRRIVIHTDNLKEYDIAADKGGSALATADWVLVKEVKNARPSPVELLVSIPFPTDRIRVRVLKTTEDAQLAREKNQRLGGITLVSTTGAPGKIREIEIYGYKSTKEMEADKATDDREQELDDLLDLK